MVVNTVLDELDRKTEGSASFDVMIKSKKTEPEEKKK
jgi:hypothetical protein